jgi:peptidylprolyl isomerase
MELLSSLPRGPGAMGFYSDAGARLPVKARIGADLPVAQQVSLEALRTDSPTFVDVVEGRRNRRDDFYQAPAGGVDICNVPLPVRPAAVR